MPNSIVTNDLTDLVALRFLVAANFVTVGSKEHFKDQMVGKRNGQEYTFVIRDAVEVGEGLSLPTDGSGNFTEKQTLSEREVKMSLNDYHASVLTNAIEAVTDLNWDKEVAEPNGAKIANYVVRKAVSEAVPRASVAVVGSGFQPLAEVAAHLGSISNEKMYGFVDPMIQAVLTANGQQFQPVGSPDAFYAKGLLGTFHNVEYRGQRFFNKVTIPALTTPASFKTADSDTVISVAASGSNQGLLVLNMVCAEADDGKILPAGTPIFVDGAFACDLIGDVTSEPFAFIAAKPATLAHGGFEVAITGVASDATDFGKIIAQGGTRVIAKVDNSSFANIAAFKKTAASIPADGTYALGQVRLDGAYEFCTLDKLDASNSESKMGKVEDITVHENRVVDLANMTNRTRWDIVAMFGVIENRGVANVLVKL